MEAKKAIIGVYKISNSKSGRYYIGYSVNIEKRFKTHKYKLSNNCHDNIFLQRAYNAYGEECFNYEILHQCKTEEEAKEVELSYLQDLSIRDTIYNLNFNNSGGDLLSHHPDKDVIREKIKDSQKETLSKMTSEERKIKYGKFGEKNGMYGKTHTEEVRKKISELKKGNTYCKGIKLSEEVKQKMSEARKGKFTGSNNPFYGKKHPPEIIEKIRQKNLGRKPKNTIKIIIDDIEYESITEAARQLNMVSTTVLWRLKSKNPKFDNYKYAETITTNELFSDIEK